MIKIKRFNRIENSAIKAFVDIIYYGLEIKGWRIIEGKNGLFLGYPRELTKEGKSFTLVAPIDLETKNEIETVIFNYWQQNVK